MFRTGLAILALSGAAASAHAQTPDFDMGAYIDSLTPEQRKQMEDALRAQGFDPDAIEWDVDVSGDEDASGPEAPGLDGMLSSWAKLEECEVVDDSDDGEDDDEGDGEGDDDGEADGGDGEDGQAACRPAVVVSLGFLDRVSLAADQDPYTFARDCTLGYVERLVTMEFRDGAYYGEINDDMRAPGAYWQHVMLMAAPPGLSVPGLEAEMARAETDFLRTSWIAGNREPSATDTQHNYPELMRYTARCERVRSSVGRAPGLASTASW